MIFGYASCVTYVAIGLETCISEILTAFKGKTIAACILPHPENEHQ